MPDAAAGHGVHTPPRPATETRRPPRTRAAWPVVWFAPVALLMTSPTSEAHAAAQAGEPPRPAIDLTLARAHWVTAHLVLWNVEGMVNVRLHHTWGATLRVTDSGIDGGGVIDLEPVSTGLPDNLRDRAPHLAGLRAFRLPDDRVADVGDILRGQVAVSATDLNGHLVAATGLQLPFVLDDLFAYGGPLGPTFDETSILLRLWAPTAQSVRLRLYETSAPDSDPTTSVEMARDPTTGVWSARLARGWQGRFYRFEVRVFRQDTGRVETNIVTDPYSVSLAMNSVRSHLVDLDDTALAPDGWSTLAKPRLDAFEDIVLYELHVRDFSAHDLTVRPAWRGTYLAFTDPTANGIRHLRSLAEAGLTHVHLLPTFDFTTVDEDRSGWRDPGDLSDLPPDSDIQQARIGAIRHTDGFNWGYDPWHYNVPEGSYATDPDGARRIHEFRAMVQALNTAGLRVVVDVVYNHTAASGQHGQSVLDRIVPGYYHRLDADGRVETSTCCRNTATEHAMMEKLMIDSVVLWATKYKVDGFRFDLMGHHMVEQMDRVRARLDALTPSIHGVDGRRIYVFGEGWDFGEVAGNARGRNATQVNMAGTGIGTFNDRLRDAARGGGAMTGIEDQGFLTGLWTAPNDTDQGTREVQRARLLAHQARIRVGLAGNLRDMIIVDTAGRHVRGDEVDHHGAPAGYASTPSETINYVEAHDNETLWDAIQLKAAGSTNVHERVRMQMLGLSLVALGQGIPLFHAGGELLRSKSLDRNSYDSGDWFNRLDFTYRSNNWGVGLPPAWDNARHWPLHRTRLADPSLRVLEAHIRLTLAHFREMLTIRRSSRLFRLRSAAEVASHLRFLNEGPTEVPGVIAFELVDDEGTVDAEFARIVVVLNAAPEAVTLSIPHLADTRLTLHPVQQDSVDRLAHESSFDTGRGALTVPGRTTGVFVERRASH